MLQRFEDSYTPEPMSGCFLWIAEVRRNHGYDVARFFDSVEQRKEIAPRMSWKINKGPIPKGLWVLHKCDNSICVNPDHLYLGTHKHNMRDREERRRGRHHRDPEGMLAHMREARKLAKQVSGERHGLAKLTWDDVRAIRTSSASNREIAEQYGIDKVHAWNIRAGKFWKE